MEIAKQPKSTAARAGQSFGVQPFWLARWMRPVPGSERLQLFLMAIALHRKLLADPMYVGLRQVTLGDLTVGVCQRRAASL